MDIVQVITDTDRRGAQVFAVDLEQALRLRGHDVRTVALVPGTAGASLDVEVLGSSRLSPRGQARLRRYAHAADVVIAHGSATAQATAISPARTSTPIVYRQISDSLRWAQTSWRRLRVTAYLSQMRQIVALHHGAATVLHDRFHVPTDKLTVIPNGVATDAFHPGGDAAARRAVLDAFAPGRPAEDAVVLYLGALVPEKGVRVLPRLAADLHHATLLVVGGGPLLEELRASAPPNLVVVGPVVEPAGILRAADLFVFPSEWGDSMPAVLIEAGLVGVPVVATDVGAAKDVVLDGVSGRIVPPARADLFAAAVRDLLDRPAAERVAMGHAAVEHCRTHFDVNVVAEAWESVLDVAVGSTSTAR